MKKELGEGSNNYVELMALNLLLMFAHEQSILFLQIFRDSQLIINWTRGTNWCHNLRLRPLVNDINHLKYVFSSLSIYHIYREDNSIVDTLSKEAIPLTRGAWMITEYHEGEA